LDTQFVKFSNSTERKKAKGMIRGTIKKVAIVCVALFLVTVLAVGLAGSIPTQTASTPSTASAVTVKSTTAAHPIFLSYEQPTILQQQSYTGPFVGSIHSNVYHYPWCYEAKKILSKNLVTFATVADACAAGYRPCEVCKPPACGTPMPTAAPSASIVATPTPTPAAASPSAARKPAAVSTATANVAQASAAASGNSSTPGFEGLYALGALAAVCIALRITRRS
jgi:hypothetical protein